VRAELEYHVIKLPPSSSNAGTFEPSVAALKQSWFTQERDRTRVLVYVRMRTQANVLAPELGLFKTLLRRLPRRVTKEKVERY